MYLLEEGSGAFQPCSQYQHVWFTGWIHHGRLVEAAVGNSVQTQQSEWLLMAANILAYCRKKFPEQSLRVIREMFNSN